MKAFLVLLMILAAGCTKPSTSRVQDVDITHEAEASAEQVTMLWGILQEKGVSCLAEIFAGFSIHANGDLNYAHTSEPIFGPPTIEAATFEDACTFDVPGRVVRCDWKKGFGARNAEITLNKVIFKHVTDTRDTDLSLTKDIFEFTGTVRWGRKKYDLNCHHNIWPNEPGYSGM